MKKDRKKYIFFENERNKRQTCLVVVFVNVSTASNDVNGSVTEDGPVTITPGEPLMSEVHVGVDCLGRRGMLNSGESVDHSKDYHSASSHGDLGPLADLLVQLCRLLLVLVFYHCSFIVVVFGRCCVNMLRDVGFFFWYFVLFILIVCYCC